MSTNNHHQPPTPAPISKLPTDILWLIFNYNSHVSIYKELEHQADKPPNDPEPESSALLDNRSCSQVCHLWRTLLLSSPSIWANSLDLSHLNQPDPKNTWRNTVLARTGSAPLTIVGGTSPSMHAPTTRFLFFILETQIHRVRRLCVYPHVTDGYASYEAYERRLCVALGRAAPEMEYLSLAARPWASNWVNGNGITLRDFALPPSPGSPSGNTRLQHLHIDGFRLALSTGCLSSLTSLHLSDVRTLSTFALFTSLLEMPRLHSLQLELMRDSSVILSEDGFGVTEEEGSSPAPCPPALPTVFLPCLNHITLCTGLLLMQDVIANIVPSTACAVRFFHYIYNVYPEETSPPAVLLDIESESGSGSEGESEGVQAKGEFGSALAGYLRRQILAEEGEVVLEVVAMEVEVPCKPAGEDEDEDGDGDDTEDEDEEDTEDEEEEEEEPDTQLTICIRIGSPHHHPSTRRTIFEFTDIDITDYITTILTTILTPNPPTHTGTQTQTHTLTLNTTPLFHTIDTILSSLSHAVLGLTHITALDLRSLWPYLVDPRCPNIQRLFAALIDQGSVRVVYVRREAGGLAFLGEADTWLTRGSASGGRYDGRGSARGARGGAEIVVCGEGEEWGCAPDEGAFSYFRRDETRVLY